MNPGVAQRLVQRLVGIGQIDIFADHADLHLVLRMLQRIDQLVPGREVGRARRHTERKADDLVEALLVQHRGHLVDRIGVPHGDDGVVRNIGKQRDLGALLVRDRPVGATQQHVRRDADLAQLLHAVLGRLGLQFARHRNERDQRQVYEAARAAAQPQAHLARRLDERQRLDVAHGAADLDDRHIGLAGPGRRRTALDEFLNLVGDVRDHLHRLAEILAAPLFFDDRFVDLAGREVVHLPHLGGDEALVMSEVEIGLGAVLGHEHFAVLERRHRAGIDIDVGVQLDEGDFEAARFEDRGERGGGDPLAEGGDHATGNEHVFRHRLRAALLASGFRRYR